MIELREALERTDLPGFFFCERLPWLPEDRDQRHQMYYTPDGEPITHERGTPGWVDSVMTTTQYKMQPENRAWTSLEFQGQEIEVATDYIGESAPSRPAISTRSCRESRSQPVQGLALRILSPHGETLVNPPQ